MMRRLVLALSLPLAMVLVPSAWALAASHTGPSAPGHASQPVTRPTDGGSGRVSADFNGDGYQDLAIGVIYDDAGGVLDSGDVNVIYGGPSGLDANAGPGNQLWSRASPGLPGGLQVNARFGRALAAGDFNSDGYSDLAIGVPYDDVGGILDAGDFNIVYGGPNGLDTANGPGAQLWTQDSAGIKDQSEPNDRFGRAFGVGDFNNDGYTDLAVSAPFEDFGTIQDAGAVNVLYGGPGGITASHNQFIAQGKNGILGQAGAMERFGWAMTGADFNADGFDDLAIGDPGDPVGTVTGAGSVNVIYGSANGLTATAGPGNQLWTQDGLGGQSQKNDLLGRVVRADDFNGDGYADLAIGAPHKTVGSAVGAGAVYIAYGGPNGLDAAAGPGAQIWGQDSPGILDHAEMNDAFGRHIGTGDFNADGSADLAIGVVGEDLEEGTTTIVDAGAVNVIYGSASGLSATAGPGNQFWTQDSTGILGVAETGDAMGRANSGFDFNGDGYDDLAIGVAGDNVGTVLAAGAANVIYGGPSGLDANAGPGNQIWSQDSPGIQGVAEQGDAFGSDFPGAPAGSAGLAE